MRGVLRLLAIVLLLVMVVALIDRRLGLAVVVGVAGAACLVGSARPRGGG